MSRTVGAGAATMSGASSRPGAFLRTASLGRLRRERAHPTAISIFTGVGGAALGISQAGIEIRVMLESDKACCETLRENWLRRRRQRPQKRPPAIIERDIRTVSTPEILAAGGLEVGEATILEGGFPCQGFSVAGKRQIGDPRNQLYKECVRVIGEALPVFFLLENVPGLASMAGGRIIHRICRELAAAGYDVRWEILDAADYGVPQWRRRIFFIGLRLDALAVDCQSGQIRLHLGAAPGVVQHPDWFLRRKWLAPDLRAEFAARSARLSARRSREAGNG